jgi:taurine dioxygenase
MNMPESNPVTALEIELLSPTIGAVIHDVDLREALTGDLRAAIYQALQKKLEGMTARHDFAHFRRRFKDDPEELAKMEQLYPNPHHPVVRVHPDTGRKSLYVNIGFTQEIDGMNRAESDELLRYLYGRASIREYQCRFRWRENSIAFWDNRSCQHYAVSDYWPRVRRMERVTIKGDRPVG